jgi:membrane dipeptidase
MRVDLHVDTLWRLEEKGGGLYPRRDELQIDAPRCEAGAVRLLCTAVFTEDLNPDPWGHCNRLLDVRDRLHESGDEPFQMVTDPVGLATLPVGVTGMLATIENASCLEGDLSRIEDLHRRGVRILGVTWNGANSLGQGVMQDDHGGLTPFGKEAIGLATELGWAIDVSHLNREGVIDVCDSGATVIATHSNAREIHDHPRNLTDDLIEMIGSRGGMVGVNLYPPFLGPKDQTITLETVTRHVLHLLEILGEDQVGLGTDLDGIDQTPQGFRDHRDLDSLADRLHQGGIPRSAVDKVLGAGFIRWWESWSR